MSRWLHDYGWIIDEAFWDAQPSPVKNAYIEDNVRKPTGLVDSKGRTIYKEPNEIGFGRKQNTYSVKG
jgi:hypothetical protein